MDPETVRREAEGWVLANLGDEEYDPMRPNDYEELMEACARREAQVIRDRRVEADLRVSEQRRIKVEQESRQAAVASLAKSAGSGAQGGGRGRALVLPSWMKSSAGPLPGTRSTEDTRASENPPGLVETDAPEPSIELTFTNVQGAQRVDAEALCQSATAFHPRYDGHELAFVAIFASRALAEDAAQRARSLFPGVIVATLRALDPGTSSK